MSVVALHHDSDHEIDLTDRAPRTATHHEQRLVGAAMLEASILDEVDVAAADFHDPRLEGIWSALVDLRADGRPTDFLTVATECARRGLRGVGPSEAHSLTQLVPYASLATAEADAAEVAAAAAARRVVAIAARMTQAALRGQDPTAVITEARDALDRVTVRGGDVGTDLADAIDLGIDEATGPQMHRATPWRDLNDSIHGWRPGRVYIIGARPGNGKTLMALGAAVHMTMAHGLDVAFASLEMPASELGLRVASAQADVDFFRLQTNRLSDEGWLATGRARDRVDASRGRLLVLDKGHVTPASVRAHARAVARRGNLGMVVVDYLQLMASDAKHENRQQEVTAISRAMKILARDLGVPVLLLSQLSRAGDSRADPAPRLSDLRESGSLEQDSDVVLLLHRTPEKEAVDIDVLYVNVAKNRQGPPASVELGWRPRHMKVTDL